MTTNKNGTPTKWHVATMHTGYSTARLRVGDTIRLLGLGVYENFKGDKFAIDPAGLVPHRDNDLEAETLYNMFLNTPVATFKAGILHKRIQTHVVNKMIAMIDKETHPFVDPERVRAFITDNRATFSDTVSLPDMCLKAKQDGWYTYAGTEERTDQYCTAGEYYRVYWTMLDDAGEIETVCFRDDRGDHTSLGLKSYKKFHQTLEIIPHPYHEVVGEASVQ